MRTIENLKQYVEDVKDDILRNRIESWKIDKYLSMLDDEIELINDDRIEATRLIRDMEKYYSYTNSEIVSKAMEELRNHRKAMTMTKIELQKLSKIIENMKGMNE